MEAYNKNGGKIKWLINLSNINGEGEKFDCLIFVKEAAQEKKKSE